MAQERYIGRDEEISATLAVGATTSGEVDLGGLMLVAIRTDTALIPTTLSFRASASSGNASKLRDVTGTEVSYSVTTSITQAVDWSTKFVGARFIVVQGGTSGGVTTQTTAASTVYLICKAI
jgi:hypothetical protein